MKVLWNFYSKIYKDDSDHGEKLKSAIAKGYLSLCDALKEGGRREEFFGLRDFYRWEKITIAIFFCLSKNSGQ